MKQRITIKDYLIDVLNNNTRFEAINATNRNFRLNGDLYSDVYNQFRPVYRMYRATESTVEPGITNDLRRINLTDCLGEVKLNKYHQRCVALKCMASTSSENVFRHHEYHKNISLLASETL